MNYLVQVYANDRLRLFLLAGLLSFLSACATSTSKEPEQYSSTDEIQISEEFGVDKDVRENFKAAVALLNENKLKEAIELLNKVAEKTDKHSAPYVNLGIAYDRLHEFSNAEKNLQKALTINPTHPVTNNQLGILYRKAGRFNEARVLYETVVKKYPQFLPARKNLGVLCDLYLKDTACALQHYEEYLKAVPTDKEVKIWVAAIRQKAGG